MLGQSAAVRRAAVLLAIWIAVLSISALLGRFDYRDNTFKCSVTRHKRGNPSKTKAAL
jgi:hypothetical protein